MPSPLRLTHQLSVLCSFSASFADSSFLRILRMKFFSPWLLTPLSYFRWRGRLPSWWPASRLGWFQLPSPLCNALLIDSKGDGLTELLAETKPRTGYPFLPAPKRENVGFNGNFFFNIRNFLKRGFLCEINKNSNSWI